MTLLVALRNNGASEDIEVQLATSGENAIKVAVLMLASRAELVHGDTLKVTAPNEPPGMLPDDTINIVEKE